MKEETQLIFPDEKDGDNVWMIHFDPDAEQLTVKMYPQTPMPPQIQKCHDVWANTLGGQRRILALEIERLLEEVKVEFPPYRWAVWVRWRLYWLTQRCRKR